MKDLDKLIEIEKERIIAAFREEADRTKNQVDLAVEDGLKRFTDFADTLKIAYNARVIGPEDLLRTIEKGGFIFHKTVDTREYKYDRMQIHQFFREFVENEDILRRSNMELKGKQKVTIIIEPLGGE